MFSAYTGELAGDSLDLAAGMTGDLRVLFGEQVGVMNLGTLGTLGTLSRLCLVCNVSFEVGFLKIFLRNVA